MAKPQPAKKRTPRFLITVPDDVKRWLRDTAKFNSGSLSSEVVRCVREKMARLKSPPSQTLTDGKST